MLAAWLVALIVLDGTLLTAAHFVSKPHWLPAALVVAAISIIPIFVGCIFVLQTRFRAEIQEDSFYAEYRKRIDNTASRGIDATMMDQKISLDELRDIEKAGTQDIERKVAILDKSKPYVLILRLRTDDYYNAAELQKYLSALMLHHSFKGIAVLRKEEVLHAYLPRRAIVLSEEALSNFVRELKSEEGKGVILLPGVIRDFLKVGSSNLQALAEMNRLRLDSHVVVGNDNKLKGVVEKSEILTQLLLGVAGIDQKAQSVRLLFAITGLKTTTSDR